VSNEELVSSFLRVEGKVAAKTRENYAYSVRDVVRYFRRADGRRFPRASGRSRTCGLLPLRGGELLREARGGALSEQEGVVSAAHTNRAESAADAARENCQGCAFFKRPTIMHRLNALSKFYKYLARLGVVEHNFLADVVSEYYEECGQSPAFSDVAAWPRLRCDANMPNGSRLCRGVACSQRRRLQLSSEAQADFHLRGA